MSAKARTIHLRAESIGDAHDMIDERIASFERDGRCHMAWERVVETFDEGEPLSVEASGRAITPNGQVRLTLAVSIVPGALH